MEGRVQERGGGVEGGKVPVLEDFRMHGNG